MKRDLATLALAMALAANTAAADATWTKGMFGLMPTEASYTPDLNGPLPANAMTDGLTEDWLMAQPKPTGDAEWQCLTEALYFEARGESLEGQIAVAEVILNQLYRYTPLQSSFGCNMVALNGGTDMVGHKRQNVGVMAGVVNATFVTLHHQRAHHLATHAKRHA